MNTKPLFAVLALLAMGACGGSKDDDDAPPEPPITFDNDDTGDTADQPAADHTGKVGSIAFVHWAQAAEFDAAYAAAGLFTDTDGGLQNMAGCLLLSGVCLDTYPAEGESLTPDVSTTFLDSTTFYDVGDLVVGDVSLPLDSGYNVAVHIGTPSGFGGASGITLDGDFAPYAGTADFTYTDLIEVTSPDPTARIAVAPGGTIDLEWTPGDGDVYLTAGGDVHHLADDGAHTVNVDDLGLQAPLDATTVVLRRLTHSEVDAAGNTLKVETTSDQWFYLDYEDFEGWDELILDTTLADSCDDVDGLTPIGAGQFYGDLSSLGEDHDLGEGNDLTYWATAGIEGISAIDLVAGDTLTVTYRQITDDASVYLLDSSCDLGNGLVGADDTLDGEEEVLVHTATEDGTVYLVLDNWLDGSEFSLVIDIQQ